MRQEPVGVTIVQNRCHRNDSVAYDIAESALLTINTNTLFPTGISRDFSILVVARPRYGYPVATVFAIYSDSGEEQLVLSLGNDVTLYYSTTPDDDDQSISFGVDISDGKWHRLGVSIKGDTVTLIVDCTRHISKELRRNLDETISVDGIIIIGQQLVDGNMYLVSRKWWGSLDIWQWTGARGIMRLAM
nr:PREDICTED: collagen alpha-2(XI) chain-like [Megachile rotundata]